MKGLIMRNLYVKYQNPIPHSSKDIAQVKVFKTTSKFKIKVIRSKVLAPEERSIQNASTSHVSNPKTFGSRDTAQVKVFQN
jgi:hypothetical protein